MPFVVAFNVFTVCCSLSSCHFDRLWTSFSFNGSFVTHLASLFAGTFPLVFDFLVCDQRATLIDTSRVGRPFAVVGLVVVVLILWIKVVRSAA